MEANPIGLDIKNLTPNMKDALLKLQMSNIQMQNQLSQKKEEGKENPVQADKDLDSLMMELSVKQGEIDSLKWIIK